MFVYFYIIFTLEKIKVFTQKTKITDLWGETHVLYLNNVKKNHTSLISVIDSFSFYKFYNQKKILHSLSHYL